MSVGVSGVGQGIHTGTDFHRSVPGYYGPTAVILIGGERGKGVVEGGGGGGECGQVIVTANGNV